MFENERVPVLEYRDQPGARTTPHGHPDSVMITLSSFRRRLVAAAAEREVELQPGVASWLAAQEHSSENIGDTETHVMFVELKESAPGDAAGAMTLGPDAGCAYQWRRN